MWRELPYLFVLAILALHRNYYCEARRGKRTDVHFASDNDVQTYLTTQGRDMTIFRCKRVVMVQWLHSVIPYVDLECEVLGDVKSVKWFGTNDTLINTSGNGRFISLSQPHYSKRAFFNTWRDYKLRMLHVTEQDNGPYRIEVSGPSGHSENKDLMLDVITDYRDDKWLQWMDKVKEDSKKITSARKREKLRRRELMRELKEIAKAKASRRRINSELIFDQ